MKKVDALYRTSILVIAFLLPSAMYGFTLAALSITFCCWLYKRDFKSLATSIKKPSILWPLLFYFYMAGGIFFTHHTGDALSALSTKISFLLFPCIIGTASVVNKKLIDTVGKVFIAATLFFLLLAVGYAAFDVWQTGESTVLVAEAYYNKFISFGLTRIYNNWHPTNAAVFACLSIALLLHGFARSAGAARKRYLAIKLFIFLLLSGSIFLLNSVNGIICFCMVLLYFGIKRLHTLRLKIFKKIAIVLLLCGSAFSLLYFNPLGIEKIDKLKRGELKITDAQEQRNVLTIRLAKWDAHAAVFKQHWLWGTTVGDIRYERKEAYLSKNYDDLARYNYNAHNQFIEVAATYGIAGFLLFMAMLYGPLFRKNATRYYAVFILITSLAFLTESLLERQQGILFFMFFYALYTSGTAGKSKKDLSFL